MQPAFLIAVFVLLGILLIVQVSSARAAVRLGGKSAKGVVAIRIANAAAVTGLLIYLAWDWFGG
jgi:hypothetical protein